MDLSTPVGVLQQTMTTREFYEYLAYYSNRDESRKPKRGLITDMRKLHVIMHMLAVNKPKKPKS